MATTLTPSGALSVIADARTFRSQERNRLERIFQYLRDPDLATAYRHGWSNMGPLHWLRSDVPKDVMRLAEMSRVNVLRFVVNAATQVLYVDGYRSPKSSDDQPGWDAWQKNGLDSRQIGVHRAAGSYGASYVVTLPGTNGPVIRGASPRRMTAVYGDDDMWPEYALELRDSPRPKHNLWRLYDNKSVYLIDEDQRGNYTLQGDPQEHGAGVCPITRFVSSVDDDGVVEGEVQPFFALQDQINITTFSLLVAQHYGAFRQRYILGWVADSEEQALTASARKLWTFEDPDVQVGEFQQTTLDGYISSREASLRHLSTVSQTPAHELLGQLVNMSAEALVQAEASFWRRVEEKQKTYGESWEQVLGLAAKYEGKTVDPKAEVRWRDSTNRSLSQTADALGKLVSGLGVPPQELWELIPGITQAQVEAWKVEASKSDYIAQLNEILTKQTAKVDAPAPDQAQIDALAPVSAPAVKPTPNNMPMQRT